MTPDVELAGRLARFFSEREGVPVGDLYEAMIGEGIVPEPLPGGREWECPCSGGRILEGRTWRECECVEVREQYDGALPFPVRGPDGAVALLEVWAGFGAERIREIENRLLDLAGIPGGTVVWESRFLYVRPLGLRGASVRPKEVREQYGVVSRPLTRPGDSAP